MQNISAIVIDDEAFMLDILQAMLEGMGISAVNTYTSATMALGALAVSDAQQVVICDLNMPGMDGVEFLRHLAQRSFPGGVIVLSGEDSRTLQTVESLGRAHHLRLLGALAKPVDRQSLFKLLSRMCLDGIAMPLHEEPLADEEVRQGLASGAVIPFFQPQVDIQSRKVAGVEALARWQHPEKGIIGPGAFIPLAEKTGLIHMLTDIMILNSMQQWRKWRDAGLDLNVSVNVSMDCLSRIDFPEWVIAEAMAVGMPLDKLILEITESRLMHDAAISLDVMTRLCLKRVRLSIDDFGTAYSNMEKLQLLPFTELKIDRAFVYNAAKNPSARAILESSTLLGKRLGMHIVAEGVETQEDWDCVEAAGCDLIQGYFVARPMPGDEVLNWLPRWK